MPAGGTDISRPLTFGKYLLLDRIGRGGMAEVYRAKTFGPGGFAKECAIKKILPSLLDDEQFVRMFIDEARVTALLTHPNIVQVIDLGDLDGHFFIAMEFVRGKDLLDLLARCARRSRRIPREIVLFIMLEALKGLDAAHTAADDHGEPLHIVHRDVSPSNILLAYNGQVKVGDFGIAKSQVQQSHTEVGTQKGKMGYMSPEQVTGAEIDQRSDLFAATVIFFEMLTMSRLFKADNDLDIMLKIRDGEIDEELQRISNLPQDLQDIVIQGLHTDADQRFQSAREYYDAIHDFVTRNDIHLRESNLAAFLREVFADKIQEDRERLASDPDAATGFDALFKADVPLFRYKDADGQIHGPMRMSMLEELLTSRAPHPNEAISYDGGPWSPIGDHAEFASLTRPRASMPHEFVEPRESSGRRRRPVGADWEDLSLAGINKRRRRRADQIADVAAAGEAHDSLTAIRTEQLVARFGEPAQTGSFDGSSAVRVIYHLAREHATGLLRILVNAGYREIYFVEGRPVAIESTEEADLLGNMLVARGLLTREDVDEGLKAAERRGLRLGDALVRTRRIQHHQLYHMLTEQLSEKLTAALFLLRGRWQWWPGVASDGEPLPIHVDVADLVVRGVGERIHTPQLRRFYDGHRREPLEQRIEGDALHGLQLSARALRVLTSTRDGDTVDDVIRQFVDGYRWAEAEVYRILFVLTEFGVFRYADEREPSLPAKG